MKSIFKILLIMIFAISTQSFGQRNSAKNGIGLILITPDAGISIKFLNSGLRHFNGAIAWSSGNDNNNNKNDDGYVHLHADYIFKKWRIFNRSATNFETFLGAGLQLTTGPGDAHLSARLPLGLSYTFNEVPIDAFIELVPNLSLVPDTDFDIDAGLAIRFLF